MARVYGARTVRTPPRAAYELPCSFGTRIRTRAYTLGIGSPECAACSFVRCGVVLTRPKS